jgi:hypothetical protein
LLKKKLEKEADNLWHKCVIKKYGSFCFWHSSPKRAKEHQPEAFFGHHFFRKGAYPILRYEITNGIPACWPCHYKAEKFDHTMLEDVLLERGKKWYNRLNKMSQEKSYSFQTIDYYRKQIIRLTKYLERFIIHLFNQNES